MSQRGCEWIKGDRSDQERTMGQSWGGNTRGKVGEIGKKVSGQSAECNMRPFLR